MLLHFCQQRLDREPEAPEVCCDRASLDPFAEDNRFPTFDGGRIKGKLQMGLGLADWPRQPQGDFEDGILPFVQSETPTHKAPGGRLV